MEKCLGQKLLDSTGRTAALVQADIATPGKADSLLKVLYVSRTQVIAAALYTLLQNFYSSYVEEHNDHAGNFDKWRQLKEDENPQFKFWILTLEIQLSVLVFVRSLRERYFYLCIQALQKVAPWMFALDHPNYARWLPVHTRDMMLLEECHPDEFECSLKVTKGDRGKKPDCRHHEQSKGVQKAF